MRVTGFDGRDARVTRITDQAVAVGAVLVAGGIGTRALMRDLGADIPVNRSPGLLAVTTPVPAGTLSRVLYPPGFHVRPDVSGGLRVGADDIDALTKEDTPPGPPPAWAQPLLDRTAAVLTLPAGVRIDHIRVGVRPVPADGHTVAGRIPGSDNAYVVVTHSAITMGPLLGRLIAEEITTGARDPLLRDFRPERFSAGRTPRPV
ncbi:MAG: FAD-binding oxidoreductase [Dehalococcoidia bacterium]